MKLIKLIERDLKHWGKPALPNELHIKEPSQFELEKAIANCNINDITTLIVYRKGESDA